MALTIFELRPSPLKSVFPAAQMHPPHPAPIVQVLIPPLQLLATLPQQPTASLSANAATIRIHRGLFGPQILPLLPPASGPNNVRTPHPVSSLTTARL
jgi:hypothetical protein